MLKDTTRQLTILNLCVFLAILSFGSFAVFFFVTAGVDDIKSEQLRMLGDTVVSTIEAPDEPELQTPDIFRNKDVTDPEKEQYQLFSPQKKLVASRGNLAITLPLNPDATIETQENPHLLLLTRPLHREGKFFGWVRLGTSLANTDRYKKNLLVRMLYGMVAAAVVSVLLNFWLVRQALKPVERVIKILTDFTADASHELKTPITAIKTNGAVALKYSEGMRESDREKIIVMLNAANQMNRTISDLLSLAESDNDVTDAETEELSVEKLLSEITTELHELATTKNVEIKTAIHDKDLSIKISRIDANLVFLNVIKNAVMYSKPNEIVTVSAKRTDKTVKFEVQDRGIGISKQDLPHIFDRFWRADKARSYRSDGNGLGLSIVKSVVERNRGTIAVESIANEGSKFSVVLPQH